MAMVADLKLLTFARILHKSAQNVHDKKYLNLHIITNINLIKVDNGVDAETVPINTSYVIYIIIPKCVRVCVCVCLSVCAGFI